jgi:hypothetical protein
MLLADYFAWTTFSDAILPSVVSFPIKVMKPASVSRHVAVKKVVAFDSILFMHL